MLRLCVGVCIFLGVRHQATLVNLLLKSTMAFELFDVIACQRRFVELELSFGQKVWRARS